MQLTSCQISGADGCHQQSSSYWDLQWTALLLVSSPPDLNNLPQRGFFIFWNRSRSQRLMCKGQDVPQFLNATVWKGPPQVCGSVQCHAVQVVEHLWWMLLLHSQMQVILQKLSVILCYYSLAISDLMVVDNTFSIVSDNHCHFACQVSGEISSDNAICSTAISVWACQSMPWFNQGLWCGVGKHHFCWGTVHSVEQKSIGLIILYVPLRQSRDVQLPS